MRTTIDIPEKLLSEAMELTNISTKAGVIKKALVDLIQREKITHLRLYRGKIDLRIDLNKLRKR